MFGPAAARAAMLAIAIAVAFSTIGPTAVAGPDADTEEAGDFSVQQTEGDYTYEVAQSGEVQADFGTFAEVVRSTLADSRGWQRSGVELSETSNDADFQVILASPSVIDSAHSVCSPTYSCRVGDRVLINDVRWREGTDSWTASLHSYRHHVVNHEVGHWLGLGHASCPASGEPAPVMQQQSIDLEGCEPNAWPLEWEIEDVADLHGTTPGDPGGDGALPGVVRGKDWYLREQLRGGAADHEITYGQEGDVALMGDWNGDGRRTPGVRRGKTWYLRDELRGGAADHVINFGRADDVPVVGDWDGDGVETLGVRRGKTWYLRDALRGGAADHEINFGRADDVPVVGDWDGDGVGTLGVRRGKTWYLRDGLRGGEADHEFAYGHADDTPVVWR